ncbi:VWA domain-containing protein [Puteibacter caeruleilacunae]|nr:VWA domain-containing protein [Puteibacter caeruleilacunae]
MFRFAHPEYLYALIIIPLLLVIFIIARSRANKALKQFGNPDLIAQLMPDTSKYRPSIKFVFSLVALMFLIVGLAQPQFGSKLKKIKREGVEIIIALDVSNSMLAEDIQPNRLERAKRAIAKMVDRMQDDRIGLVVFAGQAYTQLPITTDYASAKLFMSSIDTHIVPIQGTAIGAAIDLGMKSFTPESENNKALIIITDGENHEDDAIQMAAAAAEKGIIVHTIGMGLPKGAPIPINPNSIKKDYRKDKDGNIVVSKLNEEMLQQIAAAGNGVYVRANNSQIGLNRLFDEINSMEKTEMESRIYSEYDDQFQYLIGLAIFFILLELALLERKNRWLKNVSLFASKKD